MFLNQCILTNVKQSGIFKADPPSRPNVLLLDHLKLMKDTDLSNLPHPVTEECTFSGGGGGGKRAHPPYERPLSVHGRPERPAPEDRMANSRGVQSSLVILCPCHSPPHQLIF